MQGLFEHIGPLLQEISAKKILEIGVLAGDTSIEIMRFLKSHGGTLTSVEPCAWSGEFPDEFKAAFENFVVYRGEKKEQSVVKATGIEAIFREGLQTQWQCKKMTSSAFFESDNQIFDACLLDGDHNYFTVSRELAALAPRIRRGGIIFLHDCGVKWGRRDGYYDINAIPVEFRNGKKQGVLSAVDDFLLAHNGCKMGDLAVLEHAEQMLKNQFLEAISTRPIYNGLKIMARKKSLPILSKDYYQSVENQLDTPETGLFTCENRDWKFEIRTRKKHGLGILRRLR